MTRQVASLASAALIAHPDLVMDVLRRAATTLARVSHRPGRRPGSRWATRDADVGALADGDVERHRTEELDPVLGREPLPAAPADDLG